MRRPRPHGMPGMRPPHPPGLGPMRPPPIVLPPPPHLPPRPVGHPGMPLPPLHEWGPPLPPIPVSVSSCTNSSDPESMDSRLFVGNLNTLTLSKEDIEGIFIRYGYILGISIHKGYAFVQFSHPDEARRAGASEDGQIYAGQCLDINIVSQPKNRNVLKRAAGGRPVIDAPPKKIRMDSPGTNQSLQRTLVTLSGNNTEPVKKPTPTKPAPTKPASTKPAPTKPAPTKPAPTKPAPTKPAPTKPAPVTKPSPVTAAKAIVNKAIATVAKVAAAAATPKPTPSVDTATWPDVLICGVCKLQFTNLHNLAQHKKVPCQLRVSSQDKVEAPSTENYSEPSILICAICDTEFNKAWALCLHCTEEHDMNIYKTQEVKEEAGVKGSC